MMLPGRSPEIEQYDRDHHLDEQCALTPMSPYSSGCVGGRFTATSTKLHTASASAQIATATAYPLITGPPDIYDQS